jgi:hypothetical protein
MLSHPQAELIIPDGAGEPSGRHRVHPRSIVADVVSARYAVDELLEYLAPLGLPDDLLPLVSDLLPDRPIGEPLYQR